MMFVSWSDQNNILIYRTFEDFKKFHVSEYFSENRIPVLGRGERAQPCVRAAKHHLLSPSLRFLERAEEKIPHRERLSQEIQPDNTQL